MVRDLGRRRRERRPRDRCGVRARRSASRSRTRSPSTRTARSTWSPTRRSTSSTPARAATGGDVARGLRELGDRQARPGRRRLGHDADAARPRPGRHHRQRRPDERRGLPPRRRRSRAVCAQPVFEKGASATDNSLIGAGRSLVVENNYGYTGPASTQNGKTTAPGLERVDLDADGTGCRSVWRSQERAPTVVPKLSAANGIVYTYTKDPRPGRRRRLVPDRARLPHRQDAVQAARRRGARPQQQLRAGHARPGRHRLRRRARRPDRAARRQRRRRAPPRRSAATGRCGCGCGGQARPRCGCGSWAKGVRQVRRVRFYARGKRVGTDRRRPFKTTVRLRRGRTKVVARIARKDGTQVKRVRRVRR